VVNRQWRRVGPARLLPAALALTLSGPAPHAGQASDTAVHHALLVGVTRYDHLPPLAGEGPDRQLVGPANDVVLWRALLESFQVPSDNIRTLAEPMKSGPTHGRPTRANIERELERLVKLAGKGHQVTIVMAGHGSQQPAAPNDPDEPDGLDEIFLPADVRGWNGKIGQVENAITDNEIRDWLTRIRNTGAFVWIVFDSCHSGTMTRGVPQTVERERQIPASELVPMAELEQARVRAGPSRGDSLPKRVLGLSQDAGGLVALYAAQTTETTPEMQFENLDGEPQWYGLFTRTIISILQQRESPLTYADLAARVADTYRSDPNPRPTPNPSYEGADASREVLGLRVWPRRPTIQISPAAAGEWNVGAGSIHGLRTGSVLAVYPLAGRPNADQVVGHLRLTGVGAVASRAVPTEHADMPPPDDSVLVRGGRAELVSRALGDAQLKVAAQRVVPPARGATEPGLELLVPGAGPVAFDQALTELAVRTSGVVMQVKDPAEADWFVRLNDERIELVPRSGWSATAAAGSQTVPRAFVGGTLDARTLPEQLAENLRRIAHATGLLSLAGPAVDPPGVKVRINLDALKHEGPFKDDEDCPRQGGAPLQYSPEGRILREGECVTFVVRNDSETAVDIGLLFVDSLYGIQRLFPQAIADNPIRAGREVRLGPYLVTATTTGLEQVVVIGVRSGAAPTDFSMLSQEGLETVTRSAGRGGLQALMARALGGKGAMRSITAGAAAEHAVKLLSWTTVAR
jgi:hypothetical protein